MICITSNLGDARSIATHPASTTHSRLSDDEKEILGIMPGSIRISVGLEAVEDIKEDVARALENSK